MIQKYIKLIQLSSQKNRPTSHFEDPETKAELFAIELVKQFSCPPGNNITNQIVSESIESLDLPHIQDFHHITPNEVWKAIKLLTKKKAPGPDKISNTALRYASKKTILHLTKIFNCCLRLEHFPAPWKLPNVIMIPKPGKNRLVPTNHRPISLLNTISKLFESLIL